MTSPASPNMNPSQTNNNNSDSARTMGSAGIRENMAPLGNELQNTAGGGHSPPGYQGSDRMFVDNEDNFIPHIPSQVNDRYTANRMDMNTGHAGGGEGQLRATRGFDTHYVHSYADERGNHQTYQNIDNSYDQGPPPQSSGYPRTPSHSTEPHLNYGLEPYQPVTYRQEKPTVGPHSFIQRNETIYEIESEVTDEDEVRAIRQNRRLPVSRAMNPDYEYHGGFERFTNAQDDTENFEDPYDYEDDDDADYDQDTEESLPSRQSNRQASTRSSRHPATRPDTVRPGSEFGMVNNKRISRYSGVPIKSGINKVPFKVSQHIPEASLDKRDLTRQGEDGIVKRACGANDPENILIVNMFENDGMRWGQIAQVLNEMRVQSGRVPTFTPNSVHNRYNRNAPLLFAAEGKAWVPICDRNNVILPPEPVTLWTPELDKTLIRITKQVEGAKWATVAKMFNSQNGMSISAMAAAQRHRLI